VAISTAITAPTVIAPVAADRIASVRLAPTRERTKDWLVGNNAVVMAVLFVVFSTSLIGDAIQIRTS
jgi:hypothetical protein